ncbi:dTMP kinase [Candidatus Nitronereus thalassa]|uniref:Thymidylate kinase n=1 Tax=Candidatus Nitronereus thalassa TaxID=3020898 RepID=A0ABU3K5F2_9BACT|nr:dTMP kinase [Candidatus Nitronereus thalassa]MDT7041644.1 dTMP kinase [Candidatus Nitronereus thalassa]
MNSRVKKGRTSKPSPIRHGGLFISFEGIEGSGKSTQCQVLAQFLKDSGFRVIETREPGGTSIAEHIRDLFLQTKTTPGESLTPETEASLVFAARSQHVASLLLPALQNGEVVLCDRFSDSTLAYQGYGRGLNISKLQGYNRFITQGLTPDMTFLFDLPVQQGLARRRKGPNQNRIDQEALAFHARVRNGFLELARKYPRRITIINAHRSATAISHQIQTLMEPVLKRRLRNNKFQNSPR